jgi:hypothetical protein
MRQPPFFQISKVLWLSYGYPNECVRFGQVNIPPANDRIFSAVYQYPTLVFAFDNASDREKAARLPVVDRDDNGRLLVIDATNALRFLFDQNTWG